MAPSGLYARLCHAFLGFFKFDKPWNTNVSSCKIFIKIGKWFWRYRDFRFLKWPPVAIMDIQIFKHLVTRRVGTANSLCTVVPNFIKIGHGC